MSSKVCLSCGLDKPYKDFYKDRRPPGKRRKDDRRGNCKACDTAASYRSHLKRRYGITEDDVMRLAESQGGRCAVCGDTPDTGKFHGLHVDHCHEMGAVRGLLCRFCNLALGHAKDSPDRLRLLADYVEESPRA